MSVFTGLIHTFNGWTLVGYSLLLAMSLKSIPLVGAALVVAPFIWFWPWESWVEVGEGLLMGQFGRTRYQIAEIAAVESAMPVNLDRTGRSPFGTSLQLLLRSGTEQRLRARFLSLQDEEAFLDALAAADPALERGPGRVVRVPPAAPEKADV